MPTKPKVVPIGAPKPNVEPPPAHRENTSRCIFTVGSHSYAFDFTTRITQLSPAATAGNEVAIPIQTGQPPTVKGSRSRKPAS